MSRYHKSMYRAFLNNGLKLETRNGEMGLYSKYYSFIPIDMLKHLGWEYRLLKNYGIFKDEEPH